MSDRPIPCPKCGADLHDCGEVTHVDWVNACDYPQGKARMDLVLDCEVCGAQFNAFVALDAFQEIE